MLGTYRNLRSAGVLGINQRNCEYVLPHNPRRCYPLVDNKLLTKQLALQADIPVPELFRVAEIHRQIRNLPEYLLSLESGFVVKPASGSGGEGILVIDGKVKDLFRSSSGTLIDQGELRYHISRVLTGVYSLGGHPDQAIIEARANIDPLFEEISYSGVPDIRIIVYYGIPVMAMVRLPTRMSAGKANLHQGAIGAGIDVRSGMTLSAVWKNRLIHDHPDTGRPVAGVQIPFWDEMLSYASRAFELTGLGYQGVDIILDRDLGPLLLELNARPGLNIQLANRAGLASRLKLIDQQKDSLTSEESRIAFSKKHFAVGSFDLP